MTLAKVLKKRPKLWLEVVKRLKKMGIHLPSIDAIKKVVRETKPVVRCEPIPLNKVGDYNEVKNNNTTLPIEYNEVQSLAILDSGASIRGRVRSLGALLFGSLRKSNFFT